MHLPHKVRIILHFSLFLGFISQALADNSTVIGPVYPIAETDFIQMAQQAIKQKMAEGDWMSGISELKQSADRPHAVEGVTPALITQQRLWDPSFVVPIDIKDSHGHIVLAAGMQFNPLLKHPNFIPLLFFDGDNRDQVNWAVEKNKAFDGKDLLILVNGSIHEAALHFPKKTIYFDQGGRLVNRLQIIHVPAMVSQKGVFLQITEVKL